MLLPRLKEGALILVCALGLYFLLALLTYSGSDPGWSNTGDSAAISNGMGRLGAWLADVLFSLIGYSAYLIPLLLGYRAWILFRDRYEESYFDWPTLFIRSIGFVLVVVGCTGLASLNNDPPHSALPFGNGGILGQTIADASLHSFNLLGSIGSRIVLVALFLFGMTFFAEVSWLGLMDKVGELTLSMIESTGAWLLELRERWYERRDARLQRREEKQLAVAVGKKENAVSGLLKFEKPKAALKQEPRFSSEDEKKAPKIVPPPAIVAKNNRAEKARQKQLFEAPDTGELPGLELLAPVDSQPVRGFSASDLETMSRLLEMKLKDFGIVVDVTDVYPGPVITRFELQPAAGVKASRISNLAQDIARSLAVISVRVVEVIPGKSVVGIEIPNEDREIVLLSQILASDEFVHAKSPLTLGLGKDISGLPVVADLAKMPHLLVAGTTGSGKSVGVNAMLLSLLYKSSPKEVRLILIDPKMLELSVYEGIPHLLTPVITDMKDAANGLRWCVGEMERRYKLMAALGVRNLAGYNRKVREAMEAGEPIADPTFRPEMEFVAGEDEASAPDLEELPNIVVVIDEFADMMMIVGKKVEQLIARIAQKARAAGIHLVLATQRPSVDVITGLIKANVPTRIGFQVSSKIDSRTILDQGGAEQLLGHGDMLYLPPGTGLPVRIHGAFVDDHEVHAVVANWKKRARPNYIEGLLEDSSGDVAMGIAPEGGGDEGSEESDALYDEAVHFVTQSRRASISAVQRKLRIGYNRAARMIETMEMAGVVSEMGSNGQREVLAPPPPKD